MLIVSMTLLAAGGMLITASSQSLTMMIIGTALTGLFSVVAQILVPLAATLASRKKRGKVVGTIMSGLLLGILLARTVAGLLASLGGWRTVYWVASVLMVIMALALWRGLPKVKQENHLNYPQLLASVFSLFTGINSCARAPFWGVSPSLTSASYGRRWRFCSPHRRLTTQKA